MIFLIGLCACSKNNPVETQQTGIVHGYVYQQGTYIPLSGVKVSIESKSYTTSSDGYYELEDITSGNQTITANVPGCISYSRVITVKVGDNHSITFIFPLDEANDFIQIVYLAQFNY